jgi:ABC-type sulfate/molybdate transport systems ATPase subunit
VAVLNHGRIEQTGIPGEIYDLPTSAFVHRFLGQVNEIPVRVREGRAYLGPLDIGAATETLKGSEHIALIRPHEIEIGEASSNWPGTLVAVRVLGPIVRVDICADGQPIHEPLEAEVSRERFESQGFGVGKRVGVRFRRWQVDPVA